MPPVLQWRYAVKRIQMHAVAQQDVRSLTPCRAAVRTQSQPRNSRSTHAREAHAEVATSDAACFDVAAGVRGMKFQFSTTCRARRTKRAAVTYSTAMHSRSSSGNHVQSRTSMTPPPKPVSANHVVCAGRTRSLAATFHPSRSSRQKGARNVPPTLARLSWHKSPERRLTTPR